MSQLDISKLSKYDVLRVLYNRARPLGMGFLHYTPEDMTTEQAKAVYDEYANHNTPPYFDYLKGRLMKVELGGATLSVGSYERDNDPGSCAEALAPLFAALPQQENIT